MVNWIFGAEFVTRCGSSTLLMESCHLHIVFGCLSDIGTVLKVISLHSGNSLETEEITLEELQVFKVSLFLFHQEWSSC